MASFLYRTRTTTRLLLHNFPSPNPVIALLQNTKSPISLPPASKPSKLWSHLPADSTFSHHFSFPKILLNLNLNPRFVQHHSISTTDTKSQEPDSGHPTLLETPQPEFRHQEITGPTVERDVSSLANETREVLVSLRRSVYDLSYALAVLGVAHLGLGAWIAYAVRPPNEVSVQGFAAFAFPFSLAFLLRRTVKPLSFFQKMEEQGRLQILTLSLQVSKNLRVLFVRMRVACICCVVGISAGSVVALLAR